MLFIRRRALGGAEARLWEALGANNPLVKGVEKKVRQALADLHEAPKLWGFVPDWGFCQWHSPLAVVLSHLRESRVPLRGQGRGGIHVRSTPTCPPRQP